MKRNITFVLPGHGGNPVGGNKVVYEYANALVARGHYVCVVHSPFYELGRRGLAPFIKGLRFAQRAVDKSYLPSRWFAMDKRVRVLWIPSLHDRYLPTGDAVFATAWQTAEWVVNYGADKGEKYYLIQHYENWSGTDARLLRTWKMPLHKIVIAQWLGQIAGDIGEPYTYIPNGLDFSKFGIDIPIECRNPYHVMMLYHHAAWKGSGDGLQALERVRTVYPDLKVTLFGLPHGNGLPRWVEYHRNPPQTILRGLYNRASVFISPSWTEGWGLPPAEAMMCGLAVVATDNGGHREYATHGETALLVAPQDSLAMADAVIELLAHPDRRIQLARAGHRNIQQFTWDRACARLEGMLIKGERMQHS